jgi:hypothetical protein
VPWGYERLLLLRFGELVENVSDLHVLFVNLFIADPESFAQQYS